MKEVLDMIVTSLIAASLGYAAPMVAGLGDVDPRGVYYHTFTGSFSGSEWSTIFEKPGVNRYEFDDIANGLPFDCEILPDGAWTFDSSGGTGSFSDPDNAAFDIFVSGFSFQSQIRRVPYTTPDFPVLFNDAAPGDSGLEGTWSGTLSTIDPATGSELAVDSEQVEITIENDVLRLTRANGVYYAGPFEDHDHVAIRALRFFPSDPNFASFPGSVSSEFRNVLGELRVITDERIEGVLLLQSNNAVPNQTQELIRVELERECLADVNDDSDVTPTDFTAWVAAFNNGALGCDQNGDGTCTSSDFTAWIANYNLGCG